MDLLQVKKYFSEGKSIFDLPLKVVFYARVSTDKEEQLNSLSNQTFYYEDYIKKNINWEFIGSYVDEGISGTTVKKRNSFINMITDAKKKKFDLIITKEISRFSRNTLDSIQYTQQLLTYGVGVYFQSDNINTLLPDSELRLTIMASIAQEEVRKLSERLRFGYKRAIEKGLVLGQDNIIGYNKKNGVLTINEDEAKIVKKIFEMYIEGKLGVRRIARELEKEGMLSTLTGKMFCPDTIRNIIQNPKYKGFYCGNKTVSIDYRNNKRIKLSDKDWVLYEDENIPVIVSPAIWEKANLIYSQRGKKAKENTQGFSNRYTFSGKIICAEHQTSFHRHVFKSISKGEQEVWSCKLYRQKGKLEGCDSPTIYTKELQEILNDVYKSIFQAKDKMISGLLNIYSSFDDKDYLQEIIKKEKSIELLKLKKDKILELNMEDFITKEEFNERNIQLNKEITTLNKDLKKIITESEISNFNKSNMNILKKELEKEFSTHENFSDELSNVLLEKIIVHKIKNDKQNLKLEIMLNVGKSYTFELNKNESISIDEIGISQAQVSRLEKSALKNMKKYIN